MDVRQFKEHFGTPFAFLGLSELKPARAPCVLCLGNLSEREQLQLPLAPTGSHCQPPSSGIDVQPPLVVEVELHTSSRLLVLLFFILSV
ncbi:hypothetical protein EYF80_014600 [Liparis tanakae]|uniref:Uncharacterized protein n=1 Tax=Liparis tanakae TaxID=230148 RepID=A0A4Z2IBB8_9TELE|nr:hypothetical protein EYF80_014600 [Liparis tanakae]